MDVGVVPVRHLLGSLMAVGDQPVSAFNHDHFLAGGFHGRHRSCETVGAIWIYLGNRRSQQSVAALVFARFGALWLVSQIACWTAFSSRNRTGILSFYFAGHAVAGAQRARFWQACIFAHEFWRRVAHGKWPLRRWHLAVLSSPRASRGRVST